MFQLSIDCPCSAVFPEGLIDETIKTLSLLLPMNDHETRPWFLKQQIELHLDHEAVRCKPLTKEERSIDNFVYVYPLKLSSRYTLAWSRPTCNSQDLIIYIASGVTV